MDKSSAKKLLDEIAYQDGSVISKIILKKPAGNVTLFAFDKEQGLSEHSSPFDAVIIVIDGKVDVSIGGENFLLNEGEMINLPANIPHGLKAVSKTKLILIMIKE